MSTTITITEPPSTQRPLQIHLRPRDRVENPQTLHSQNARSDEDRLTEILENTLNYITAIDALMDIKEKYDPKAIGGAKIKEWKDSCSKKLFKWINRMSELAASILLETGDAETLSRALEEVAKSIDELAQKLLVHPMGTVTLDNPLIEEDCYLWSGKLLGQCQAQQRLSPYTKKPINAVPHAPAREILAWAKHYFPETFPYSVPLECIEENHYLLIQMNANVIVNLQKAKAEKKKAKAELTSLTQKESQWLTTFKELLRKNAEVEKQLRQEMAQECERLNNALVQQRANFGNQINFLQSLLDNERSENNKLSQRIIALAIKMHQLENYIGQLENKIINNQQALDAAWEKLNHGHHHGCSIM